MLAKKVTRGRRSKKVHAWFCARFHGRDQFDEIKRRATEAVKELYVNAPLLPEAWYRWSRNEGLSVTMDKDCIRVGRLLVCHVFGFAETFDCEDLALAKADLRERRGTKEYLEWLKGEIKELRRKCWTVDFNLLVIKPAEKGDDVEELIKEFRESGRRKVALLAWLSDRFFRNEQEGMFEDIVRAVKALRGKYDPATGVEGARVHGMVVSIKPQKCLEYMGIRWCEASGSTEPVECVELKEKRARGVELTRDEKDELRWCWQAPITLISVEPTHT